MSRHVRHQNKSHSQELRRDGYVPSSCSCSSCSSDPAPRIGAQRLYAPASGARTFHALTSNMIALESKLAKVGTTHLDFPKLAQRIRELETCHSCAPAIGARMHRQLSAKVAELEEELGEVQTGSNHSDVDELVQRISALESIEGKRQKINADSDMGHRQSIKHVVPALRQHMIIECENLFWSDPGADIDDEIAMWVKQQLTDLSDSVLCIGGKGNLNAWVEFCNKVGHPNTFKYSIERGTIPEGVMFKPRKIYVIAPGIDTIMQNLDCSLLTDVIYQGNLPCNNPQFFSNLTCPYPDEDVAFNDTGSLIFLQTKCSNVNLRCVTSKECNLPQNLFNDTMFKLINLPFSAIGIVQRTVWKNLVGRMHSKHPFNKFAEGLINPDIKGANYYLAKSLFEASGKTLQGQPSEALEQAVTSYIGNLGNKATQPQRSRQTLLEMSRWIGALIGRDPIVDGELMTSSTEDMKPIDLHTAYAEAFQEFCKMGIYSPAFDLVAVIQL